MESGDEVSEISLLKEFIQTVDWTEPWLLVLIGFHLFTTVSVLLLRHMPYAQAAILSVLGVLCLASEWINELAAANYDRFSAHQYFDSAGFFITVVFSGPIIFNCFLIVMCWLWMVWDVMGKLAVKKIQRRQRQSNRQAKDSVQKKKQ